MSDEAKNLFDAIATTTTLIGAVIAFLLAKREWKIAQDWERAKICLAEIARLVDDDAVRKVCLLIDWQDLKWPFDVVQGDPDCLTDDDLVRALRFGNQEGAFKYYEVILRSAFDRLFDAMSRAAALANDGLVDRNDLLPYLGYWCDLLDAGMDARGRPQLRGAIRAYMRNFGFAAADSLITQLASDWRRIKSQVQ